MTKGLTMKTLCLSLFGLLLATGVLAQGRIDAFTVNVETDHFERISLDSGSLPRVGWSSRYRQSAQHLADWLDDNLYTSAEIRALLLMNTNGWLFLKPGTNSIQSTFDFIDDVGTNGIMRGTNISDSVYNPTNKTWELNNFVPGTNISDSAYNPTNKTWELNDFVPGTNIAGLTYSGGQWSGALTTNYAALVWQTSFTATRSTGYTATNVNSVVVSNYTSVINPDGTTADPSFFSRDSGVFYAPVAGRYHLYSVISGSRNDPAGLDLLVAPISLTRGADVSLVTEVYESFPIGQEGDPAASFHMETHAIVNMFAGDAANVSVSTPYRGFSPVVTNWVSPTNEVVAGPGLTIGEMRFGASLITPYYPPVAGY